MTNATAPPIYSSSRYENVTPLLRQLHWLKASPQQIDFKLDVLAYRCMLMNSTWLWTTDSRITTNDRMSYASFYNQWLGFSSCHHSYLEWSASAHNLSTLTTSFQSTFEDLLCPNVLPMNTKCLLSNNLNSLTAFCYIKQVLKVIWQKGRITAAHGRFNHIRQGRQCDHLTHASLGLPKYIPKTASWSSQPFLHSYGKKSLYFTMGWPFPLKISPSHGDLDPI